MEKKGSGQELTEKATENQASSKSASAYLWTGFSGDINLTTYDLFRKVVISDIAFGSNHSLFLTNDGHVYVRGDNGMGQLGLGSLETKVAESPIDVQGLPGPVTKIACGKHHNAVVTEMGQVFCWGSSKEGQCGTGTLDLVLTPTCVAVEINEGFCQHGVPKPATAVEVKAVACGASHTLAISVEGEIWAWGCGPQLGLGELMHAPVPRRVDALQGRTAVAVCCGEKHSLALVLRGERSPSRSASPRSSPAKVKHKTEAKDVHEDKHYPSRCSVCKKEIYTYTDTSDMCIIDTLHDCNVNDSIRSVDSTIVEDISSSSSSDALKKSGSTSPAEGPGAKRPVAADAACDTEPVVTETDGGPSSDVPEAPKVSSHSSEKGQQEPSKDSFGTGGAGTGPDDEANDSSLLYMSAMDSSLLVIPQDTSLDTGDLGPESCDGESAGLSSSAIDTSQVRDNDSARNEVSNEIGEKSCSAQAGEGDSQAQKEPHTEDKGDAENKGDKPGVERTVSTESDGAVWKRQSGVENTEDEIKIPPMRERARSPSNVSVKSLNLFNQSGAMEYLQRQFEDDDTPTPPTAAAGGGSKDGVGIKSAAARTKGQGDKSSVFRSNVFVHYPASMMEQVKSMTSRAFTNIQTLSMFGSPTQSDKSSTHGGSSSQLEMTSVQPGTKGQSSKAERTGTDSPDRGNYEKSGTFVEWSQELPGVNDDPAGGGRDLNQRSLRTIQMQQQNLTRAALSSTSDISAASTSRAPVVTATEVWVWGSNDYGQLGLGDQLERTHPTIIRLFVGRHVVKLAAGDSHSIALTANSQVYTWGSNSYGQLGQQEAVHGPTRIKFMKGCTAWDIGAGAMHSVFLSDTSLMHPDVFYCGKHASREAHSSVKKTSALVSLESVSKVGWIIGLTAGDVSCACRVLNPAPPETEAVFELAASERAFYNQLIKTSNLLLRPLQKSDFYSSMDVFPYKSLLQNLVASFGALTKKIGECITDLTGIIQTNTPVTQSLLLSSHGEFLDVFRNYSRSFSNFLAVGGFDYCTRTGSEFFTKIQTSIQDLSEEKDKVSGASSLFLRAMRYPFFRLVEYTRILAKIADSLEKEEMKTLLHSIMLDWDSLKLNFSADHKVADSTRAFWDTVNTRFADSLRTPERRMLRDSKTSPLQWPASGRFSSHQFVLFNDFFVLSQNTALTMLPLDTVWVESDNSNDELVNAITIISPEERFELCAATSAQKAEWLISFNSAISKVLTDQKAIPSQHSAGMRFTPPLIRHATHTFVKAGIYKEASYDGTWLSGKVHGTGVMKWPNGSIFEGNFKRGLMHGSGVYTKVKSAGKEVQKGSWKDGKLNGLVTVSYANGDLYEGFFQDGQRFGHGMYQSGRTKSSCTSIYIGEWMGNMKDGYGVFDDILRGEKYMGMWVEDHRHGPGVMVTLDGMYFEGNFVQNKLTGFGVMISDDNTLYEGDFMGITHLSGKGTLTLPSGDKLDGNFSGTLNEGLKINGTFIKVPSSPDSDRRSQHQTVTKSKYFGRLCVQANNKWEDIFSHACSTLGQGLQVKGQDQTDTNKAWEMVAVMVSAGRKSLKEGTGLSTSKVKSQLSMLEGLEKIPFHGAQELDTNSFAEISAYLLKAFDSNYHPLGQLMETLVDVFRASYIGVGAHPRLLHHAIQEVRSYIQRVYRVVRVLFPALPANGGPINVHPPSRVGDIPRTTEEAKEFEEGLEMEDPKVLVLTAAGLLYPILLPKIYPPLFDLYALFNEKSDDRYWERVTKLNRQSDMGLMAYLGIEQRFWLMEDVLQQDKTQKLSTIKDVCYAEAVDTLQHLSTAFSPVEKLIIIEQTFNEITKTVTTALKDEHMWCMDDLFPIFQFVVVRAKIHHLGAEIHMIEDLMEAHLEHGEFGIMFTMLKACYFQIQNEKMPHH